MALAADAVQDPDSYPVPQDLGTLKSALDGLVRRLAVEFHTDRRTAKGDKLSDRFADPAFLQRFDYEPTPDGAKLLKSDVASIVGRLQASGAALGIIFARRGGCT